MSAGVGWLCVLQAGEGAQAEIVVRAFEGFAGRSGGFRC